MLLWRPEQWFASSDVYIIGGGPSLSGFDFSLLKGRHTIGCNAAFKLGPDICNICFFSDHKWFDKFQPELAVFAEQGGTIITHCESLLQGPDIPYVKLLRRQKRSMSHDMIGFNGNSGCSAVNLALIMGAKRVFLLGFDCRRPDDMDKSHWHNWRTEKPNPDVYAKFMEGWRSVAIAHLQFFKGTEIINLGPESAIECFPKADYREFLNYGNQNQLRCG